MGYSSAVHDDNGDCWDADMLICWYSTRLQPQGIQGDMHISSTGAPPHLHTTVLAAHQDSPTIQTYSTYPPPHPQPHHRSSRCWLVGACAPPKDPYPDHLQTLQSQTVTTRAPAQPPAQPSYPRSALPSPLPIPIQPRPETARALRLAGETPRQFPCRTVSPHLVSRRSRRANGRRQAPAALLRLERRRRRSWALRCCCGELDWIWTGLDWTG